ncbi:putative beta-D-xylosidase 7-like [Dorcoceras hygrometricum]|uniref:Putative beta-D-xylosidase 7-like n=1 Tax=Dorcoceras hygrometricum TaxID=472368 RepID=A0A2Z7DA57_9LAMI|nr:putative beta-D-xylosidase 7-like [Dorcoceras hygrometricum]
MTSAGTSACSRSYSGEQEDSADEKRCARYGMSCDDISLDVITISSWLSADEEKRERRSNVVLRFSRWISADDVIGDICLRCSSCEFLNVQEQRAIAAQELAARKILMVVKTAPADLFDPIFKRTNKWYQSSSVFLNACAPRYRLSNEFKLCGNNSNCTIKFKSLLNSFKHNYKYAVHMNECSNAVKKYADLCMEVRSKLSYVSPSFAIGKIPLEDFDCSVPTLQPTPTTLGRKNS